MKNKSEKEIKLESFRNRFNELEKGETIVYETKVSASIEVSWQEAMEPTVYCSDENDTEESKILVKKVTKDYQDKIDQFCKDFDEFSASSGISWEEFLGIK